MPKTPTLKVSMMKVKWPTITTLKTQGVVELIVWAILNLRKDRRSVVVADRLLPKRMARTPLKQEMWRDTAGHWRDPTGIEGSAQGMKNLHLNPRKRDVADAMQRKVAREVVNDAPLHS